MSCPNKIQMLCLVCHASTGHLPLVSVPAIIAAMLMHAAIWICSEFGPVPQVTKLTGAPAITEIPGNKDRQTVLCCAYTAQYVVAMLSACHECQPSKVRLPGRDEVV